MTAVNLTLKDGVTTNQTDTIENIENVIGGSAGDKLTGNALDNVLEGGADVDTILGLAGDDAIDGDAGDDIINCGDGDGDILLDTTTDAVTVPVNCEL